MVLARLLEAGLNDEAGELLDRYGEEESTDWAYGKVQLDFRRGGSEDTGLLLGDAFAMNPFVPEYLLGRKAIPDPLPDYVGYGDETEAQAYASLTLPAWQAAPGALARLTALIDAAPELVHAVTSGRQDVRHHESRR